MTVLTISVFERDTDANAIAQNRDPWEAFIRVLSDPFPQDTPKRELPLWSPALFKNDYRNGANVETVSLLVFDVDAEPIPSADDQRKALAGIKAAVHSSSSATFDCPRWRTAIALSRHVTASEYTRLWHTFTAELPFKVGPQAKDPSRAWYMPRVGPDGFYEVFEVFGQPLDVEAWLAKAPPEQPHTITERAERSALEVPVEKTRQAKLKAAATLLGNAWPERGNRHDAQLALAGALCTANWDKESAFEFLCEVCKTAGDEDRAKRRTTIERTWKLREEGKPITGWTALKSFVGAPAVEGAQGLLRRDDIATLREQLGTTAKAEGAKPEAEVSSMGFEFGVYDVEPPPTEFLVDSLLPTESISMWYGRADSLKTWLIYSLGIALATGQPFLGTYKTKPCRVGIVDYETGKNNIRRRLYMLGAGRNKNLGAAAFPTLKPNQPEFWIELAKHKFNVVFIDSLRRGNQGNDENDSGEAIVPLELAAEFAEETNCAVVFIHHAKKAAADGWPEFRGSAAIEDQVDCAFVVRKLDVSQTKKIVEVKCTKPGDMPLPDPFSVEVEFNDQARRATLKLGDKSAWGGEPEDTEENIERIYAQIRLALASGPKVKSDIAEGVRGRRTRIWAAIDALVDRGEIFIQDKKYALDDEDKRRQRVFEQIERSDRWKSTAALARAACVPTSFVENLVTDRIIGPRAFGGGGVGGFVVLDRQK